ncbi:aminotransferase class III-fold pyridoxal phosphate-dependent enzyme [Vibrio lentus]|nr:aminotransferase class III-fold pyridoxal phosphate-dependent enzyme [Vibrio lentus]
MGRSGEWFTHQAFDIEPDILCIGKGFGGGLVPIAAMITKRQIQHRSAKYLLVTTPREKPNRLRGSTCHHGSD